VSFEHVLQAVANSLDKRPESRMNVRARHHRNAQQTAYNTTV
jgi:hypothetical protein